MVWPTLGSRTAKEQNKTKKRRTQKKTGSFFCLNGVEVNGKPVREHLHPDTCMKRQAKVYSYDTRLSDKKLYSKK